MMSRLGRRVWQALWAAALCTLSIAAPVQAFDQNGVVSLLQTYQQLCGRVLAAPTIFHEDPRSNFGIAGEVQYSHTEDFAYVDYIVSAPSPVTPGAGREYGVVSVRSDPKLEQSCFLHEYTENPVPPAALAQIVSAVQGMIGATDGFSISGGRMIGSLEYGGELTYSFAITGMFAGEDILTLFNIGPFFIAVEHTHISTLD